MCLPGAAGGAAAAALAAAGGPFCCSRWSLLPVPHRCSVASSLAGLFSCSPLQLSLRCRPFLFDPFGVCGFCYSLSPLMQQQQQRQRQLLLLLLALLPLNSFSLLNEGSALADEAGLAGRDRAHLGTGIYGYRRGFRREVLSWSREDGEYSGVTPGMPKP